jgi:hypothetical protein
MPLDDCPTEILLKEGRIVRGREAILERADGIRIPIVPYPTPLLDDVGAVVGVVNMTVDITERKRAELELSERNAQLALAGKAALVGSYRSTSGQGLCSSHRATLQSMACRRGQPRFSVTPGERAYIPRTWLDWTETAVERFQNVSASIFRSIEFCGLARSEGSNHGA